MLEFRRVAAVHRRVRREVERDGDAGFQGGGPLGEHEYAVGEADGLGQVVRDQDCRLFFVA